MDEQQLAELAAMNPGVDKDALEIAQRALRELRAAGIASKGYSIEPPLGRPPESHYAATVYSRRADTHKD